MRPTPGKAGAAVEALLEVPFRIEVIADVPAPDGSDAVWQRYVITQGTNTIVGRRAGSRAEVVLHVEDMVTRLNERRLGKYRTKSK